MKSYIMRKYATARQQQKDTSSNFLTGTAGALGGYAGYGLGGAAGNIVAGRMGMPSDVAAFIGGRWRGAGRDYLNVAKKYMDPMAVGKDIGKLDRTVTEMKPYLDKAVASGDKALVGELNNSMKWLNRGSKAIRGGSILGSLGLGGLSAYLANKSTKTPQGQQSAQRAQNAAQMMFLMGGAGAR